MITKIQNLVVVSAPEGAAPVLDATHAGSSSRMVDAKVHKKADAFDTAAPKVLKKKVVAVKPAAPKTVKPKAAKPKTAEATTEAKPKTGSKKK
jgi:hypothetical protein